MTELNEYNVLSYLNLHFNEKLSIKFIAKSKIVLILISTYTHTYLNRTLDNYTV